MSLLLSIAMHMIVIIFHIDDLPLIVIGHLLSANWSLQNIISFFISSFDIVLCYLPAVKFEASHRQ